MPIANNPPLKLKSVTALVQAECDYSTFLYSRAPPPPRHQKIRLNECVWKKCASEKLWKDLLIDRTVRNLILVTLFCGWNFITIGATAIPLLQAIRNPLPPWLHRTSSSFTQRIQGAKEDQIRPWNMQRAETGLATVKRKHAMKRSSKLFAWQSKLQSSITCKIHTHTITYNSEMTSNTYDTELHKTHISYCFTSRYSFYTML